MHLASNQWQSFRQSLCFPALETFPSFPLIYDHVHCSRTLHSFDRLSCLGPPASGKFLKCRSLTQITASLSRNTALLLKSMVLVSTRTTLLLPLYVTASHIPRFSLIFTQDDGTLSPFAHSASIFTPYQVHTSTFAASPTNSPPLARKRPSS
jgi:hypothetical protein